MKNSLFAVLVLVMVAASAQARGVSPEEKGIRRSLGNFETKALACALAVDPEKTYVSANPNVVNNPRPWNVRFKEFSAAVEASDAQLNADKLELLRSNTRGEAYDEAVRGLEAARRARIATAEKQLYVLNWNVRGMPESERAELLDAYEACMKKENLDALLDEFNILGN